MYECRGKRCSRGDKDGMGTTLYPSLYGDRTCVFVSWNRLLTRKKITTPVRRGWRVTQKGGPQEWQKAVSACHATDVYEQLGKDSCAGTLVFEGTLAELVEGGTAVVASEAGCVVGTAATSESTGTGRDWRARWAMN